MIGSPAINQTIGDNVTKPTENYDQLIARFNKRTEQLTARKDEEDRFVDVDNLQLELLGDPVLSKEFIMKSLYG